MKWLKLIFRRNMARGCTELEALGATPEQVKVYKKYMGFTEHDILETLNGVRK